MPGSHLDFLKVFTFPSSTTVDRVLAAHWYQVVSNLQVAQPFQQAKDHALELIKVMRDERVIVAPFTTLPRRRLERRDQRKLLKLAYLTPEIILEKIKRERIRRLCTAFKSLQTYKFQKPWIIFLEEDEEQFLTDNMADGDRMYFIVRSLQFKKKLQTTQLTLNCQKFLINFQAPSQVNHENRINVIYIRTGTKLEGQLALFWLLLIYRATDVSENERNFLLELTFALFSVQRTIAPFNQLPPLRTVKHRILPDEVKHFISRFPRNAAELNERLSHESGMRMIEINAKRFGSRRRGFLLDYFQIMRYYADEKQSVDWFLNQARPKFFWEREKRLEKMDVADIEVAFNEKIQICSGTFAEGQNLPERKLKPYTLTPEEMEKLLEQDIADISMPPLDISFDPEAENKNFDRSTIFFHPQAHTDDDQLEHTRPPPGFDCSLSMVAMTSLLGDESFPNENLSDVEPPPELDTSLAGTVIDERPIYGPVTTRVRKEVAQLMKLQQANNQIPSPPPDATDEELFLYQLNLHRRLNQAIEKCQQIKMQQMDLAMSKRVDRINDLDTVTMPQVHDTSKSVQPVLLWPYAAIDDDNEVEAEPVLPEGELLW